MLASGSKDPIPAWKVPLLERRRQQANREKQSIVDESARLDQMPAWKRDIYLKKNMQKNSAENHVERSQNYNSFGQESAGSTDDELYDSERILPIQRNPILQLDIRRRPVNGPLSTSNSKSVKIRDSRDFSTISNGIGTSPTLDHVNHNYSRAGYASENDDFHSDDQEEMTYGRGFVSKLLGRFQELSDKNYIEAMRTIVPKRTYSSENLLNLAVHDVKSPLAAGSLQSSKGKARSMENLFSSASEKPDFSSRSGLRLSLTNGQSATVPPSSQNGIDRGNKTSPNIPKIREPASEGVTGGNSGPSSREPVGENKRNSLPSPISLSTDRARDASLAPEDELPRSNIVLLTRTVFESIGTSPGAVDLSNSRKKPAASVGMQVEDGKSEPRRGNERLPEPRFHDAPDGYGSVTHGIRQNAATSQSSDKFKNDAQNGLVTGSNDFDLAHGFHDHSQNRQQTTRAASMQPSGKHEESYGKSDTGRQLLILDLKDLPVVQPSKSSRNAITYEKPQTVATASLSDADREKKNGPGSLVIRPASNLLASSAKVEYLNLTKYNDIKTGEFAPPKKRPSYYDEDDDVDGGSSYDSSIPVTNLDDVMDDVGFSPKEGDPSVYGNQTPTFEFQGAGVIFNRSLLRKSKGGKQLKIRFDETAEQTFEYPSEQSLMDEWGLEEGDDIDLEGEDHSFEPNSSLKNTPGIGSGGSLASYKSRSQVDYQIGIERPDEVNNGTPAASSHLTTDASDAFTDEHSAWSGSASSDLLF